MQTILWQVLLKLSILLNKNYKILRNAYSEALTQLLNFSQLRTFQSTYFQYNDNIINKI